MENLEDNTNNSYNNVTDNLAQNFPPPPPPYPKNNFRRTLVIVVVLLVFSISLAVGVTLYLAKSQPENGQAIIPSSITAETLAHLPPDPGPAGKATIQGIDSDGDGVRDDLQRYIALTYPSSEKTRAALTQSTKAIQTALLDANDKQASINDALARSNAADCLGVVVGTGNFRSVFTPLLAQILNTSDRSHAFILADNQIGGQVFEGRRFAERKALCAFSPDAMEN